MNPLESITVLRNLLKDQLFSSFLKKDQNDEALSVFLNKLYNAEAETNFLRRLQDMIILDENAFSLCCASGKTPSTYLCAAYKNDLELIFGYALKSDAKERYSLGKCTEPFDATFDHNKTVKNLEKFYRKYGFGKFINNSAFEFKNNQLIPINNPSDISLSCLKNYEYEKKIIGSNIENFLKDLPFSDMLLYGDRGTGKSSTIHAMLNKYYNDGLRLIELKKENILDISEIRQHIFGNPMKFIIFIDDLSLDEYDPKTSSLKASLEGSVASLASNAMIVATSNRRHIIKESFSDRDNSVHINDSIQEQLSLSDRFGLTVMFSSTDKQQYLSIIKQLAADASLTYTDDELCSFAERWAIVKGGRSPRRAKQLIDLLYSCQIKGEQVDF